VVDCLPGTDEAMSSIQGGKKRKESKHLFECVIVSQDQNYNKANEAFTLSAKFKEVLKNSITQIKNT
jgi:hypothetical protein